MKISNEQPSRQELLQAFKETAARFDQPLPGTMNLLDAYVGLLSEFSPDLPLADFSPFSSIETAKEKLSEPFAEIAPTARQPVSRDRGRKDSSRQVRVVSDPKRSSELNQTTRTNGRVDSSKHAATVPAFKVAPASRNTIGEKRKKSHSDQTGILGKAGPLSLDIGENAADEKPVHVDLDTRTSTSANDPRQKGSRTENDLPNGKVRPQISNEPSPASALVIVGRLADELLTFPPEAGIDTPVPPDKGQNVKTPPAEIKQLTSGPVSESRVLFGRRTVDKSTDQSGQNHSNTILPDNLDPTMNTGAAVLTISQIGALTDRLLADNRFTEYNGRRSVQRFSRMADEVSDPIPIRSAADATGTEKQILQKPASASTENAPQIGSRVGLGPLNQPRFDTAGSTESPLTAEQLAELINDVLVDQARRHGVDLS